MISPCISAATIEPPEKARSQVQRKALRLEAELKGDTAQDEADQHHDDGDVKRRHHHRHKRAERRRAARPRQARAESCCRPRRAPPSPSSHRGPYAMARGGTARRDRDRSRRAARRETRQAPGRGPDERQDHGKEIRLWLAVSVMGCPPRPSAGARGRRLRPRARAEFCQDRAARACRCTRGRRRR